MSDIIYTPPASSGGTTINPTNNFIPVRSNATTFVDSLLFSDTDNLKSVYSGNDIGLRLDFVGKNYQLGDFTFANNNSAFYIDDTNEVIYTTCQGGQKGILFDFPNANYFFGDFNGLNNGCYLQINDNNKDIRTYLGNTFIGFVLDLTSYTFAFGDFNGANNSTYLQIKDNNKTIELNTVSGEISQTADLLRFSGALTSGSAGGSSGQHLQVTINGTQYKIKLENP
jgi:hypothetical protein